MLKLCPGGIMGERKCLFYCID